MFKRIVSLTVSLGLLLQQTVFAYTASLNLSGYLNQGPNLAVSDRFRPISLRYFSYQPLTNDFKVLLDKGDTKDTADTNLKASASVLLDYFKIGLSLPNDKFWVNLRPDSEDEIIDEELAKTDLGKVMLEADLKLKQDTALFTSPQTPQGKAYWDKLYKKAAELFGTENITIPTLTRPWIVPGEIILRESNDKSSQGAYIYKANLKVMLEEDYLKSSQLSAVSSQQYEFNDPRLKELNQYSTQLIRELILPKLTQKVNSSKDYANLRQVYFSLILARWFKETFSPPFAFAQGKQSIVNSPENNDSYIKLIDSNNLTNLTSKEAWDKTTYFNAYQKSFQEGEYNLSEPIYTPTGQVIRRYMSGGISVSSAIEISGFNVVNPIENMPNKVSFTGNEMKKGMLAGSPLVEDEKLAQDLQGVTFDLIGKEFKNIEMADSIQSIINTGDNYYRLKFSAANSVPLGKAPKDYKSEDQYKIIELFSSVFPYDSNAELVLQIKVYKRGYISALVSKDLNADERTIIAAVIRQSFQAEYLIVLEDLFKKTGLNPEMVETALGNTHLGWKEKFINYGEFNEHRDLSRGRQINPLTIHFKIMSNSFSLSKIEINYTSLRKKWYEIILLNSNDFQARLSISLYENGPMAFGFWEKFRDLSKSNNAYQIQTNIVETVMESLGVSISPNYIQFRDKLIKALNAAKSSSSLTVKEFSQKLDKMPEKGVLPREEFLKLIEMASQLPAREEISEDIQEKIYATISRISKEEAKYILPENESSVRQARTIGSILTIIESGLSAYQVSEEIKLKLIKAIEEALTGHPEYPGHKQAVDDVITAIKAGYIKTGEIKRFVEHEITRYPSMKNVINFEKGLIAELLEKDERADAFSASIKKARKTIAEQNETSLNQMLMNDVTRKSLFDAIVWDMLIKEERINELEKILDEQMGRMNKYFISDLIKNFPDKFKKARRKDKKDILDSILDNSKNKNISVSLNEQKERNELRDFLAQCLRSYYLKAAQEVMENKQEATNTAKKVIQFLSNPNSERYFYRELTTVASAWNKMKGSSSALTALERTLPEVIGGIDFRQMNMLIRPQGSFASSSLDFSLPALSKAEIESFDLDKELAAIQRMASSGIAPSYQRLKEYLAVCFAKERTGKDIDNLKLCLLDIFEKEQFEAKETPDGYKEVLVIADTKGYVLRDSRLAVRGQNSYSLN